MLKRSQEMAIYDTTEFERKARMGPFVSGLLEF